MLNTLVYLLISLLCHTLLHQNILIKFNEIECNKIKIEHVRLKYFFLLNMHQTT